MTGQRHFRDLLERRWGDRRFVCVGLDPDWNRIPDAVKRAAGSPADTLAAFCSSIVDATADIAGAYKPNAAFFEAQGADGVAALGRIAAHIRAAAPAVPIIYDAKRGDIGSTNVGYARHAFDILGMDAITVHPYFGQEALAPFLGRAEKGIFVLCRTSNPGAGEFQDFVVGNGPERLYEAVARRVAGAWNERGNCAVVVGATYPAELARVRAIVGDMPILIPGVGAQGGDIARTLAAGRDSRGVGTIVSASRAIIHASDGDDFAAAARGAAGALNAILDGQG